MIIVCITLLLVTLIVCATIIYVNHNNNIDSADKSKLEDINMICANVFNLEMNSKQPFDIYKYKDVVKQIYNITKHYKL